MARAASGQARSGPGRRATRGLLAAVVAALSLLPAGQGLAAPARSTGLSPAASSDSAAVVVVSASPQAARPTDPVVVSFTAGDTSVVIAKCSARLDGVALPACSEGESSRQITFSVPSAATPGAHTIDWDVVWAPQVVTYRRLVLDPSVGGKDSGSIVLTVLPRVDLTGELDRPKVHRGETLTFTATADSPTATVPSCTVSALGVRSSTCASKGTSGSATITVPDDAPIGPAEATWSATWVSGRSRGSEKGSIPFTVLADPPAATVTAGLDRVRVAPGDAVRLRLVPAPKGVRLTACSATLDGASLPRCRQRDTAWDVSFVVPADTRDGTHDVAWEAEWADSRTRRLRTGADSGVIALTVAAPTVRFTPTLTPSAAEPRDRVTLDLTTSSTRVRVVGCTATLLGHRTTSCVAIRNRASVTVDVPADAPAGGASLVWSVTYEPVSGGAARTAKGSTGLTVLPAVEPRVEVTLDQSSASPGDEVTLTYAVTPAEAVATACGATLGGATVDDCVPDGPRRVVRLTVPDGLSEGRARVDWALTWSRTLPTGATVTGSRTGALSLDIQPRTTLVDWLRSYGGWVSVGSFLGLLGLGRVLRPHRHQPPPMADEGPGPAVVPPALPVTVRVRDRRPDHVETHSPQHGARTTIRFETRTTRGAVTLKERP